MAARTRSGPRGERAGRSTAPSRKTPKPEFRETLAAPEVTARPDDLRSPNWSSISWRTLSPRSPPLPSRSSLPRVVRLILRGLLGPGLAFLPAPPPPFRAIGWSHTLLRFTWQYLPGSPRLNAHSLSNAATSRISSTSFPAAYSTHISPFSLVAFAASPVAPLGFRSCASHPNPTPPSGVRCSNVASMRSPAERKFSARAMFTSLGWRCSMTLVSTSPPCSPCFSSVSEKSPSGRPKENQSHVTTSIPRRLRRSLATTSAICGWPPWELKSTSLRTPARATDSPMSVQTAVSVEALREMVPAKSSCSTDLPYGTGGRRRNVVSGEETGARAPSGAAGDSDDDALASSSSRRSSNARFNTPALMAASTHTGRCGPCCSIAPTGRSATHASASRASNSAVVRSVHSRSATARGREWGDDAGTTRRGRERRGGDARGAGGRLGGAGARARHPARERRGTAGDGRGDRERHPRARRGRQWRGPARQTKPMPTGSATREDLKCAAHRATRG